jgi:autotransporter adhesin
MSSGSNSTAVGQRAQATSANSVAIGNGAVVAGINSIALGANAYTSRDNTVSVGSASNQRTISNVAPGVQLTDAVNVAQLNQASLIANRGIAGVAALAALPSIERGKTFNFGLGFGNYGGSSAIAVGMQARLADEINLKVGVSSSSGSYVSSVGLGFSF